MYLHFDQRAFASELKEVLEAFHASHETHERHKELATRLRDPACSMRKTARFGIIANCVNCLNSVGRAIHVIWQEGVPVEVSLQDGECPHCSGKSGFHFVSANTLHA